MRARHPGAGLPGQPLSAPRTEADRGAQSRGDGRDAPGRSGGGRGEGSRAPPSPGSIAVSEPSRRRDRPSGPSTHSCPFSAWQSGLTGVSLEGTEPTR